MDIQECPLVPFQPILSKRPSLSNHRPKRLTLPPDSGLLLIPPHRFHGTQRWLRSEGSRPRFQVLKPIQSPFLHEGLLDLDRQRLFFDGGNSGSGGSAAEFPELGALRSHWLELLEEWQQLWSKHRAPGAKDYLFIFSGVSVAGLGWSRRRRGKATLREDFSKILVKHLRFGSNQEGSPTNSTLNSSDCSSEATKLNLLSQLVFRCFIEQLGYELWRLKRIKGRQLLYFSSREQCLSPQNHPSHPLPLQRSNLIFCVKTF